MPFFEHRRNVVLPIASFEWITPITGVHVAPGPGHAPEKSPDGEEDQQDQENWNQEAQEPKASEAIIHPGMRHGKVWQRPQSFALRQAG